MAAFFFPVYINFPAFGRAQISLISNSAHPNIRPIPAVPSSVPSSSPGSSTGPCQVIHCPCSFATSGGPVADINCLQCQFPPSPAPVSTEPLLPPSKSGSDTIQLGALRQSWMLIFTTGFLSIVLWDPDVRQNSYIFQKKLGLSHLLSTEEIFIKGLAVYLVKLGVGWRFTTRVTFQARRS